MIARLSKFIGQIFWTIVVLIFVNNPASPFSIPVFWHGTFYWRPIFQADYVMFYQILFSIFLLADLLIATFEYLFPRLTKHCEIANQIIAVVQMMIIRDIPKNAIQLSASILDRFYPAFFWVMTILIFFTVIGIIVNILRLSKSHFIINKPK